MNDFISLFTAATLNVAVQGEWSYIGQCDTKRHMFTSTNDYFVLKNKKKGWSQIESQEYSVSNNIITLGHKETGDFTSIKIEKITPGYMSFCSLVVVDGTWDCDPSFYMERCNAR